MIHQPPAMVFHCPFPISRRALHSANLARPVKMLAAFRQAGYRVIEITGCARRRRVRIKRLKRLVSKGLTLHFAYSESSNLPLFFGEANRIPRYPFLEYRFFRWLRRKGIPTALFLRDLHWRFPHFRRYPFFKRLPAILFYWLDWLMYQARCSHLFLPALPLSNYLPTKPRRSTIGALPPGCEQEDPLPAAPPTETHKANKGLNLLYVGGITPPLYDLNPLFRNAQLLSGDRAVICCRMEEWAKVKSIYGRYEAANVAVVHSSGFELAELYREADLFALLWKPYLYLELIVPYKIFESVGYNLPIVTFAGTEAARLIEAEGFGWVVKDSPELLSLLARLRAAPELLHEKRIRLRELARKHSWVNRARSVAETLRA